MLILLPPLAAILFGYRCRPAVAAAVTAGLWTALAIAGAVWKPYEAGEERTFAVLLGGMLLAMAGAAAVGAWLRRRTPQP